MNALAALALVAALASGCATFSQVCEYDQAGHLIAQETRSTVVGTGETELATDACAALSYATQDTGLSDNGKAALGVIAEGAAAGASGGAGPALGGVIRGAVERLGDGGAPAEPWRFYYGVTDAPLGAPPAPPKVPGP